MKWAQWWSTNNRQLADTKIGDVRVSTVFLATDHNHLRGGPPLLFETMVFGGSMDLHQERYVTYNDALLRHAAVVTEVIDSLVFGVTK